MFNNRGQSLVLFILVLPILLGIAVLVIDVGEAFYQKNEMAATIELVLDYALAKEEEIVVEELLEYNLQECQNVVSFEDGVVVISSKTYVEGVFSNILDIDGFLVESEYRGYWDNDKKVIEKVK